ncbi:hypothetical protein KL918_002777 [Ogataea parapolymorpha]|uniref:37S ribosomal protein mrp10, mitochondrial n=1 Tax=Ogataea parapolymorpha (strain ATCC 26012 / BCRC 20466 / JCM 22074 / NRRL Y-7560 / DL-1) TaxID=871575 RepID=W1QHQ6_OGAPD|nr:hypothetical protein HPODL_00538 [Ogataea parapolymorpha DL-1]ESX01135.1 hypothetical protein HPODL_00538 [Ogataea parapolymorpha DL-1]KAG7867338.1 hypothetical protein KL918_002777 [Ogataea parapolymorpha]KAG7871064.1 hypothetical protein KL916_004430 [Ogataea parapolymorpha]KAG7883842.1 hypothetical protein KL938_002427 [Ogataea parapolymorpha]
MRPKHTPAIPPLPRLKIRSSGKKGAGAGKCAVVMSQMLNCWAANGEGAAACKELEQQLRECMYSKKAVTTKSSPMINFHASRLLPKIHRKADD